MSARSAAGRAIGRLLASDFGGIVDLFAVLHLCCGLAYAKFHSVEIDAPTSKRNQLAEPQLRERGQQDQEPVPGLNRCGDREHLVEGHGRTFIRLVLPGAPNPTRVAPDQVVIDRSGEDGMQNAVGLRHSGWAYLCF